MQKKACFLPSLSVFKQAWRTVHLQLLTMEHLGSLSPTANRLEPCTPPMYIIPPRDDQHHMPDIPGQHSQSMQRMTKANFHPIGSTLLTACNLLISLARPLREGAVVNRGVCLQSLLWCKVAFPSWKIYSVIFFSSCFCSCSHGGMHYEKITHWHLVQNVVKLLLRTDVFR